MLTGAAAGASIIEIWTDGSLNPAEALIQSSKLLRDLGRPPGPLYARPQRGSDSPSNAGTVARAASHASTSRSSAS